MTTPEQAADVRTIVAHLYALAREFPVKPGNKQQMKDLITELAKLVGVAEADAPVKHDPDSATLGGDAASFVRANEAMEAWG